MIAGVTSTLLTGRHRVARTEEVVYGRPFNEAVRAACEQRGLSRLGILAPRSLGETLCNDLKRSLSDRHVETFSGIGSHSPLRAVFHALQAMRAARVDGVIALGGGSVVDAAKAVRHGLRIGANDFDGLFAPETSDGVRGQQMDVCLIAVPTTLSGAEFTSMAGLTDDHGRKRRLETARLGPEVIVLDPSATLETPIELWNSTGMRALDHAVETVCSNQCDVLSEAMALEALPLLAHGLQAAANAPFDLLARQQCQLGMWLACTGPSAGVPMGASHGIGHILGAEFGLPHGITSCVMMAAVIDWNRSVVLERQKRIEQRLNLPGQALSHQIKFLLGRLGLPSRLSDVDIGAEKHDAIAERSMSDFFIPTNPRPIRSTDDLREILRRAA